MNEEARAALATALDAGIGYTGLRDFVPDPKLCHYVPAALAKPGTRLFADVRGTKIPLDVAPLPFTQHRYHKG